MPSKPRTRRAAPAAPPEPSPRARRGPRLPRGPAAAPPPRPTLPASRPLQDGRTAPRRPFRGLARWEDARYREAVVAVLERELGRTIATKEVAKKRLAAIDALDALAAAMAAPGAALLTSDAEDLAAVQGLRHRLAADSMRELRQLAAPNNITDRLWWATAEHIAPDATIADVYKRVTGAPLENAGDATRKRRTAAYDLRRPVAQAVAGITDRARAVGSTGVLAWLDGPDGSALTDEVADDAAAVLAWWADERAQAWLREVEAAIAGEATPPELR